MDYDAESKLSSVKEEEDSPLFVEIKCEQVRSNFKFQPFLCTEYIDAKIYVFEDFCFNSLAP